MRLCKYGKSALLFKCTNLLSFFFFVSFRLHLGPISRQSWFRKKMHSKSTNKVKNTSLMSRFSSSAIEWHIYLHKVRSWIIQLNSKKLTFNSQNMLSAPKVLWTVNSLMSYYISFWYQKGFSFTKIFINFEAKNIFFFSYRSKFKSGYQPESGI